MADTDDNGGGELAPLGIIKKARLDRAQQPGETSRVRDVAETGKSRGQEIPPTLFKYAINGNGRHDLDYYSTDVLLVCQSLVCMARGSTSMRRSGRNTKSQGVQGPQERSSRWMRVQLRAGRPRQSDIDELSRRGARRLGGGALHRSPRQSRENMKQVSVRSIFGSSTHHPCLSTLGGRSRHIHAMRWMGWGRPFSRGRSGCRADKRAWQQL